MPPWAIPRQPWYCGASVESREHAVAVRGTIEVHVHADRIGRTARKAVAVVERDVAHRPTLKRSMRYAGKPRRAHLALHLVDRILVTNPLDALRRSGS